MSLPDWLTVDALKRRLDKDLTKDDTLLAEMLEGAFEQAQEAPPLGSGRLLTPDPPLDAEGNDTGAPVTREIVVTSRRILIPDARTITAVTADGEPITGYGTLRHKGLIAQIELPRSVAEEWDWEEATPFSELAPARREPRPERTIEITGRFGFLTAPFVFSEAIYELTARRFYQRQAEYADTVKVGEGTVASVYYKQLSPSAAAAFEAYALPDSISGLA